MDLLDKCTIIELREKAIKQGINLKGLSKKGDIIKKLRNETIKYKKGGNYNCSSIYSSPNIDGSCWADSLISCLFYPIKIRTWFIETFIPAISQNDKYREIHRLLIKVTRQYEITTRETTCPSTSPSRVLYNAFMKIDDRLQLQSSGFNLSSFKNIINVINEICIENSIENIFEFKYFNDPTLSTISSDKIIIILKENNNRNIDMKLKTGQHLVACTVNVPQHALSFVRCNYNEDIWIMNTSQTKHGSEESSLSFKLDTINPFVMFNESPSNFGLIFKKEEGIYDGNKPSITQHILIPILDSILLYEPTKLQYTIPSTNKPSIVRSVHNSLRSIYNLLPFGKIKNSNKQLIENQLYTMVKTMLQLDSSTSTELIIKLRKAIYNYYKYNKIELTGDKELDDTIQTLILTLDKIDSNYKTELIEKLETKPEIIEIINDKRFFNKDYFINILLFINDNKPDSIKGRVDFYTYIKYGKEAIKDEKDIRSLESFVIPIWLNDINKEDKEEILKILETKPEIISLINKKGGSIRKKLK